MLKLHARDTDLNPTDSPGRVALFNEIATHVQDQLQASSSEPAQKRRKVETSSANGGSITVAAPDSNAADEAVLLEVKEISVAAPQRKKFELCLTANHLYARAPGTTAPIPSITYAWKDIGTSRLWMVSHCSLFLQGSWYNELTLPIARICLLSPGPRKDAGPAQLRALPSRFESAHKDGYAAIRTARLYRPSDSAEAGYDWWLRSREGSRRLRHV